jgi:hypothetical protein
VATSCRHRDGSRAAREVRSDPLVMRRSARSGLVRYCARVSSSRQGSPSPLTKVCTFCGTMRQPSSAGERAPRAIRCPASIVRERHALGCAASTPRRRLAGGAPWRPACIARAREAQRRRRVLWKCDFAVVLSRSFWRRTGPPVARQIRPSWLGRIAKAPCARAFAPAEGAGVSVANGSVCGSAPGLGRVKSSGSIVAAPAAVEERGAERF